MAHTCHAKGCERRVPPKMFMCKTHWYSLPKKMRDAVWSEYVPGQEITKTPTKKYLKVVRKAIKYVEQKEAA